jgi:drug/metabolite transporter (DMT)-like permease
LTTKFKAHAAVIGANFSIVKYISPSLIKPFGLNVVRVLVSLALFWMLYLLKPSKAGIKKEHIGRFVLCALTGVFINQMLFVKGLSMTYTIHASLLILTTPIMITFIAAWLLKEMLSLEKIIGLLLGVGGAVLLILMRSNAGSGRDVLTGDVLVTLNAISYAFYFVLVKPLMREYNPIHVLRWVFTFGAIMILPFGWNEFTVIPWDSFSTKDFYAIGFAVLGATFFAYLFNVYSIRHLGASVTGAYIYSQPVFAAIISLLFLHEDFNFIKLIAAVLIFTGVYLVGRNKKAAA